MRLEGGSRFEMECNQGSSITITNVSALFDTVILVECQLYDLYSDFSVYKSQRVYLQLFCSFLLFYVFSY